MKGVERLCSTLLADHAQRRRPFGKLMAGSYASPRLRLREHLARGLAPRQFCAMPGTHARTTQRGRNYPRPTPAPQGCNAALPPPFSALLGRAATSPYSPRTAHSSLSTSACNRGPRRPRRRTTTERSTAANLCIRKTDVTRRPVRANSGCVISME